MSFPLYSGALPRNTATTRLGEDLMDNETDTVGGYAVPTDPMDLLQCESCQ